MKNTEIALSRTKIAENFPELSEIGIELILSSMVEEHPELSTAEFFTWLDDLNKSVTFDIEFVPLTELKNWNVDELGNVRHESGKFFSIQGIRVKSANQNVVKEWDQPIINQPEVGFLGILCQKRGDVLCFLMQGKIEPGNVNKIQLSPTLQATKSNFMQVHGGNVPKFLEYFKDEVEGRKIIVDQLQSEQGARFLRKRNRNMIIEMPASTNLEVPDNFCWLTLNQLKYLLSYPNLINMDTRTVLSCIQIV
ncbi:NDP-hexose 2,3-dehydratase family protein [Pedobacter sp. GR22-10]|uniref:NDP-hexose 2,3-dehydratase family protein n=1 Tax=Pedobacter sp. GR22-10 TaxID=2994472 RepID=UPI0022483730|nr:NDP-hexose 2,3-dehydratase family protein [Pedobacter sp. GR22-10]MCX2432364.1 NDP-hexose 2,3-dehydratase family protein [Pedobacter sp. GR22-10]